jgi:hypothetical protein
LPADAIEHKGQCKWDPKWTRSRKRVGSVLVASKDMMVSKTVAAEPRVALLLDLINVREGGV